MGTVYNHGTKINMSRSVPSDTRLKKGSFLDRQARGLRLAKERLIKNVWIESPIDSYFAENRS